MCDLGARAGGLRRHTVAPRSHPVPSGAVSAYPGAVEILWWLAFPAVATLGAMGWVAWAGRPEREPSQRDSDQAYERFAAAVTKPHPTAGHRVAPTPLGRVSGVAVRRRPTGPSASAVPTTSPERRR